MYMKAVSTKEIVKVEDLPDVLDIVPIKTNPEIKDKYSYWLHILLNDVDFSLKADPVHTRNHASRVLMHALIMSYWMNLTERDIDAVAMASIFHDTRRKDNSFDVGHGARAAEYYKAYTSPFSHAPAHIVFDGRAAEAMAWHDHDDIDGLPHVSMFPGGINIYCILKDADALDRFRLNINTGLDKRYLRTDISHGLISFARKLVSITQSKEERAFIRRISRQSRRHYHSHR